MSPRLRVIGGAAGFLDERRPVAQLIERKVLFFLRRAGDRSARECSLVIVFQTMQPVVGVNLVLIVRRVQRTGDVARQAVACVVVGVIELVARGGRAGLPTLSTELGFAGADTLHISSSSQHPRSLRLVFQSVISV